MVRETSSRSKVNRIIDPLPCEHCGNADGNGQQWFDFCGLGRSLLGHCDHVPGDDVHCHDRDREFHSATDHGDGDVPRQLNSSDADGYLQLPGQSQSDAAHTSKMQLHFRNVPMTERL